MSAFPNNAVAVESAADFLAWLDHAPGGAVCRYHQGDLACDRVGDAGLGDLAHAVLNHSTAGQVELLQRRVALSRGIVVTGYYAVKRRAAARAAAGGEW